MARGLEGRVTEHSTHPDTLAGADDAALDRAFEELQARFEAAPVERVFMSVQSPSHPPFKSENKPRVRPSSEAFRQYLGTDALLSTVDAAQDQILEGTTPDISADIFSTYRPASLPRMAHATRVFAADFLSARTHKPTAHKKVADFMADGFVWLGQDKKSQGLAIGTDGRVMTVSEYKKLLLADTLEALEQIDPRSLTATERRLNNAQRLAIRELADRARIRLPRGHEQGYGHNVLNQTTLNQTKQQYRQNRRNSGYSFTPMQRGFAIGGLAMVAATLPTSAAFAESISTSGGASAPAAAPRVALTISTAGNAVSGLSTAPKSLDPSRSNELSTSGDPSSQKSTLRLAPIQTVDKNGKKEQQLLISTNGDGSTSSDGSTPPATNPNGDRSGSTPTPDQCDPADTQPQPNLSTADSLSNLAGPTMNQQDCAPDGSPLLDPNQPDPNQDDGPLVDPRNLGGSGIVVPNQPPAAPPTTPDKPAPTPPSNTAPSKPANPAPAPGNHDKAKQPSQQEINNYIKQRTTEVYMNFGVPKRYVKYYVKYGEKHGVPSEMLVAQGKQESGFDKNISSSAGAQGIAQFMPGTWQAMKKALGFPSWASPNNPRYAIEAQAYYMGGLKKEADHMLGNGASESKREKLALAGYNAGWGAVQQYNGIPPYSETENYIQAIYPNAHDLEHQLNQVRKEARHLGEAVHDNTGIGVGSHGKIVSHNIWNEPVPDTIHGHTYIAQGDLRWATHEYNYAGGSGRTIGGSACGPEAALNLILNVPGHRNVGPVSITDWMQQHGYRIDGGTSNTGVIRAIKHFAHRTPEQISVGGKSDHEVASIIRDGLKNGYMYVISGIDSDLSTPATSAGHFWVISDIDPHDHTSAYVLDPNSTTKSMKSWDIGNMVDTSRNNTGFLIQVKI